jgi:rubrerythrin
MAKAMPKLLVSEFVPWSQLSSILIPFPFEGHCACMQVRVEKLSLQGGTMKKEQLNELLYQALETELGGVQVYTTALRCVVNDELREEWEEYLEQTKNHVQIVQDTMEQLGLDKEVETPGRLVVRHTGESLVKAMEMSLESGEKNAAQLVAAESVILAETKDHLNWHLIGEAAKKASGDIAKALKAAHDEVEDEEDEHLYHTTGWTRELWIESLGLPAVLPPPEEVKEVKTAIGASRAEQARTQML